MELSIDSDTQTIYRTRVGVPLCDQKEFFLRISNKERSQDRPKMRKSFTLHLGDFVNNRRSWRVSKSGRDYQWKAHKKRPEERIICLDKAPLSSNSLSKCTQFVWNVRLGIMVLPERGNENGTSTREEDGVEVLIPLNNMYS